uniref:Uncharacterized protein n=1 Tax=Magallana gigas TaxID=29159 RepID=A0A8W8MHJ0_MAGGI
MQVEKMLQAALFIVICGCVMTYNHDCQTCIGYGVFNCQSSHFSKCAVIHGSESTIREIRLFNCDAWIIPTGWSPDSHVTIRDSNGKPCEDYRHFKTVESNTLDPFTSQVTVTNEVPKVQIFKTIKAPRKGSNDKEDDDDDEMFDIPTATGFLAWAITYTLTIILIILKKYLIKQCKDPSQPDTQPNSAIPLSNMNAPSPTLSTSSSSSLSYGTPPAVYYTVPTRQVLQFLCRP